MEGWIKLHRKFLAWEWYGKSEMVHLYIHLLLSANHEPGRWRGIEVKRGQVITGIHTLSNETSLSTQTIRTCLTRLQKTGEINRESNNQFSIITILNYDSYNNMDIVPNKQTNKRVTSKQQATNNKQECKKNKKNIYIDFFGNELKKSGNNSDYQRFIEILNGDNSTGQPLTTVLQMEQQLTWQQFKRLMYFKSKYRINVTELLEAMDNNATTKKRKSVWMTFQTYMKNQYPETKKK